MNKEFKNAIHEEKIVLGIEFGSTRIKAVMTALDGAPIASGTYDWENQYVDGVWTYSLEMIETGLQSCYANLKANVLAEYGETITGFAAMGFSAMMHGYIVLNEKDEWLVPFRTWRNTMTEEASEILTRFFEFHIPQRWSIAHLFQAIAKGEEHVKDIKYLMTLAVYIHYRLTGQFVAGIGEASGMFPIDSETLDYDHSMIMQFDKLVAQKNFPWKIGEILPKVLVAGEDAGCLTEAGAKLLDPAGDLKPGVKLCPPEGDAGTGMVATNSVKKRTGNVSAGTSVFSMVVLEKPLKEVHDEIDVVTTPDGATVAMVHCNNCSSDLNAWMNMFKEMLGAFGKEVSADELYGTLFAKALEGAPDAGGLLSYNYFSGEHITGMNEGRPLFARAANAQFDLANFMRVQLMSAFGVLKLGNDILLKEEGVTVDRLYGHGGIFKTPVVGQRILGAALHAPVAVMTTAGEGGAWGIALLASYMVNKEENESLSDYLEQKIFKGDLGVVVEPTKEDIDGFDAFASAYKKGLPIEETAINKM